MFHPPCVQASETDSLASSTMWHSRLRCRWSKLVVWKNHLLYLFTSAILYHEKKLLTSHYWYKIKHNYRGENDAGTLHDIMKLSTTTLQYSIVLFKKSIDVTQWQFLRLCQWIALHCDEFMSFCLSSVSTRVGKHFFASAKKTRYR